MTTLAAALLVLLTAWAVLELAVRLYVAAPLAVDFYGSISRQAVRERQQRCGVRVARGIGWAHLGWIADPEVERYRIDLLVGDVWQQVAIVRFGSLLVHEGGTHRVLALPLDGSAERVLGEVVVSITPGDAPLFVPCIDGPWRPLFRPTRCGDYINDHTVYRDAHGHWRLIGITAKGDGNYADEKYFANAVSDDFPPVAPMDEDAPMADFGDLAWAPHVIKAANTYHLFWSPHRLHRMTSTDGVTWSDHRVVMETPFNRFFRDAVIVSVAMDQWLLYSTARGRYFSRVDVYQSFDLEGWQYIGPALRTAFGSERNGVVASTESPALIHYRDRFYLALTYNNDSFFWPALLLPLRIWLGRESYNDTLVFHSANPYDFGVYAGRKRSPTLLTQLRAHAAEFLHQPEQDKWYITTAGWPWVATLTTGEVAIAPLRWESHQPPAAIHQPPS